MFIIPNSTNNKPNTTTTMFVNINIISPAMHLFFAKKNTRFKVF